MSNIKSDRRKRDVIKMKKKEYLVYNNRKKHTINFLIVLIGVAAIMFTGFAYANKLKQIDSYAFSKDELHDDSPSFREEFASTVDQLLEG